MRPAAQNRSIQRTALRAGVLMSCVVGFGMVGYHAIEGWSWFDGLYMTIITVATVGYAEIHPLSTTGRAFTVVLILGGVSNLAYTLGAMTEFFAAGGWEAYRRRSRMQHILDTITDHTIVCGYGRLGAAIVRGLRENKSPLVVAERSDEVCGQLREANNIPYVQGDAEDDRLLHIAGITRARALVAALNDDASNVFLCLTARELNAKLVIYAKADNPATLPKLLRAGANHVFSPAQVAGHRVAWQIVRPAVTDLIGIATDTGRTELAIEEVRAGDMDGLLGVALAASPLWGVAGVMVLAIKSSGGGLHFPPSGDYVLEADDHVVVMGKVESLAKLGIGSPTAQVT